MNYIKIEEQNLGSVLDLLDEELIVIDREIGDVVAQVEREYRPYSPFPITKEGNEMQKEYDLLVAYFNELTKKRAKLLNDSANILENGGYLKNDI